MLKQWGAEVVSTLMITKNVAIMAYLGFAAIVGNPMHALQMAGYYLYVGWYYIAKTFLIVFDKVTA